MISPKNSNLLIRIASAVVALAVLFSLYYFLKNTGLLIIVALAALMAQAEFSELVIERPGVSFSRALMVAGCFLLTISSILSPHSIGLPVGIVLVVFFSFFMIRHRDETDLEFIRNQIGISALGLLYVGLLPAFIVGTVRAENGDFWFLTLLALVFSGDTFAYFFGRAMGKTKILPSISPNKTWAGAIGGLAGSILAGSICKMLFFPEIPTLPFVLLGLLGGAFAQVGDFFESLLKRVAGKKDSGSIMPGHGGILDRIDGVLFAAPFVYFASRYFAKIF